MMKKYFENITDNREQGKVQYNMLEIIIMTIIAVVAGGEHWTDIADYCKSKKEWFQQVLNLELKNGVPIDDTFQRILQS